MTDEQLQAAAQIFGDLEDERANRGLNHNLVSIVCLVFCAVMSGAESFREIQTFGEVKRDWLGRFLDMGRVPDHETIRRVMTRLNPAAFQHCAFTWIQEALGGTLRKDDHVAIDGKRLRGSQKEGLQGVHLLNVWSVRHGLCLGVQQLEEGENEIAALPSMLDTLEMLELAGCVVSVDAMGTQREVARRLTQQNANYILALKGNQPTLLDDVQEMMDDALHRPQGETPLDTVTVSEHNRGRTEVRSCAVLPAFPDLEDHDFPGVKSVVKITSERSVKGVTSTEERYFLSSLDADAAEHLRHVRSHWEIENLLHWSLDVAFHEDENTTTTRALAQNLAVVRRWVLNLIRQEGTYRSATKGRKCAAWDDGYRERLLQKLLQPT